MPGTLLWSVGRFVVSHMVVPQCTSGAPTLSRRGCTREGELSDYALDHHSRLFETPQVFVSQASLCVERRCGLRHGSRGRSAQVVDEAVINSTAACAPRSRGGSSRDRRLSSYRWQAAKSVPLPVPFGRRVQPVTEAEGDQRRRCLPPVHVLTRR